MSKRDYASYNVLSEEVEQEEYNDEHVGRLEPENNIEVIDLLEEDIKVVGELNKKEQVIYKEVIVDVEPIEENLKPVLYSSSSKEEKVHSNKSFEGVLQEEEDEIYSSVHKINLGKEERKVEEDKGSEKKKVKNEKTKKENRPPKKDTSFSNYVERSKNKERGFIAKWTIRLVKVAIFIMLLPIVGIIAAGVLGVLGLWAGGVVACVGTGLFICMLTVFIASQITPILIALGISVAITAISFGLIALLVGVTLIKWFIGVINSKRKKHRILKEEGRL